MNVSMDPFKKKLLIQSGITIGIIAVLLLGITFFSRTITDYAGQITSLRNQIAARSGSLNALAILRSQSSLVDGDTRIMNNAVPVKDQLINLTKEFQLLASQSGLSSSFSFLGESPSTATTFGTIRFKLNISGNFEKLLNFIPQLQNFKYISSFDNYSITRTSGDNGTLITNGQIYYRQQ